MILQINSEWRIESDTNQWIVQRYRVRKKGDHIGAGDWVNEAYCTDPASAALWCAQRRIRDLPGTYPAADALEAMGEALQAIVYDNREAMAAMARAKFAPHRGL